MSLTQAILGVLTGLLAGILSGAFGVGGGIVMVPAIRLFLNPAVPVAAIASPLPVIFPTAVVGAYTYHRAGQVSLRAAAWAAPLGALGAFGGAALTRVVNPHVLLLITAVLVVWQAIRVARGKEYEERPRGSTPGWQYALMGLAAGVISGALGVGGGIIMVPVLTAMLGMPLKRALGTSLVAIMALVIPGTIAHAAYGNVDWGISLVLVLGVMPGARIGALLALRAKDRNLRIAVAVFLALVALVYGGQEVAELVRALS